MHMQLDVSGARQVMTCPECGHCVGVHPCHDDSADMVCWTLKDQCECTRRYGWHSSLSERLAHERQSE